ncbi:unnamed protein product [Acanthosepion pharaonis]|uniref:Uncharacterized protein n=1 Tax=Acanthosepion pharaonis TaxID=158019 RepID=A0A812CM87_ACAPH|nr:unnamed protein product [Sepia pharaonis]
MFSHPLFLFLSFLLFFSHHLYLSSLFYLSFFIFSFLLSHFFSNVVSLFLFLFFFTLSVLSSLISFSSFPFGSILNVVFVFILTETWLLLTYFPCFNKFLFIHHLPPPLPPPLPLTLPTLFSPPLYKPSSISSSTLFIFPLQRSLPHRLYTPSLHLLFHPSSISSLYPTSTHLCHPLFHLLFITPLHFIRILPHPSFTSSTPSSNFSFTLASTPQCTPSSSTPLPHLLPSPLLFSFRFLSMPPPTDFLFLLTLFPFLSDLFSIFSLTFFTIIFF